MLSILFNENYSKSEKLKPYKEILKNYKIDIINEEYNYDSMLFSTAVRKDKRSIIQIFINYMYNKVFIIYILKIKSFLIPNNIKCSMIIFYLFSSFFLSAFTYNEEYINNDFEGYDSTFLEIYDYIERATISATFLMYIIKINHLVISLSLYLDNYKNNTTDSNEEKEASKKDIVEYYINRYKYYFVIMLLLCLIYWYFIIIFCNIFINSQIKVIFTFFITICINLILEFLICLIYALFRILSIKCESM